jgi:branched-chain amino acid transport system ATP-binding protein
VILSLRDLDLQYGQAQALFGISLDLAPGEAVALLGRNGAGKTSTLKAAMGLLPTAGGTVSFDGQDITGWPSYRAARLGLGYVPEDRRIFTDLSVAENLEVGRRPAPAGIEPWTAERLTALFPNLAELMPRRAGRLSGGEQQMLALARTLMGNPRVLLLDEPSEGLAPVIVDQLAQALSGLRAQGIAILLSEQNLRFAGAIAERAAIIERGRIVHRCAMPELLADDSLRRRYFAV